MASQSIMYKNLGLNKRGHASLKTVCVKKDNTIATSHMHKQ